jgi:hypothetical protein
MENAKHDKAFAVEGVAKDVCRIRDFKYEFAVLRSSLDCAAEQRMILQEARLFPDFHGNDLGKARMPVVKERGKAIEIGQRNSRPLELHRACQGLKPGVPQVSSQRTTSS